MQTDETLRHSLMDWLQDQRVPGPQGLAVMITLVGSIVGKNAETAEKLHISLGIIQDQITTCAYQEFMEEERYNSQ